MTIKNLEIMYLITYHGWKEIHTTPLQIQGYLSYTIIHKIEYIIYDVTANQGHPH